MAPKAQQIMSTVMPAAEEAPPNTADVMPVASTSDVDTVKQQSVATDAPQLQEAVQSAKDTAMQARRSEWRGKCDVWCRGLIQPTATHCCLLGVCTVECASALQQLMLLPLCRCCCYAAAGCLWCFGQPAGSPCWVWPDAPGRCCCSGKGQRAAKHKQCSKKRRRRSGGVVSVPHMYRD